MARSSSARPAGTRQPVPPPPHPSGEVAPSVPPELVPQHVAVVMDGNGRWANARGLPRTAGHAAGEAALLDVVAGAIDIGVKHVSAYAFSTENWKRSPEEVRFLMGFSRDVLRRQRDTLDEWGVRVRWSGRRPRLWRSVIKELEEAERRTVGNDVCTLTMCVNYGGRAEIADAAKAIGREVAAGRLDPERITERTVQRFLDEQVRIRQELRAVRRNLDADIDDLGTWLKVINIALVPLLLTIIALGVVVVRRRKKARL